MSSKVYVNLTSSFSWNRRAVGIIRTEQSIALALHDLLKDKVGFFILIGGRAVEVPIEIILKKSRREFSDRKVNLIETKIRPVGKAEFVYFVFRAIYTLLPTRLRERYDSAIYRFITSMVRTKLGWSYLTLAYWFIKNKFRFLSFSSKDLVFTCGMDWEANSFQSLIKLKSRHQFRLISTCYDLIPVLRPDLSGNNDINFFRNYFDSLVKFSDHVVCISDHSRYELGLFAESIGKRDVATSVVNLGDAFKHSNKSINTKPKTRFVVFVSTIEIRKNHRLIIDAYELAMLNGKFDLMPEMHFIGMSGWLVDDVIHRVKFSPYLGRKIKILNNLNDDELREEYSNCLFAVFPSLAEGWGLPVVEAMNAGKFVICSDINVLREAGQNLAEYVNPLRPDHWLEKILFYSNNIEEVQIREERIARLYKSRSWTDVANDLNNKIFSALKD